ncbi:beta-ketoacyl-[acyl-carrier-protein] synthase family protein [Wenzhouxiangella marina]|uniref:3-oxoacyl-ACP synthase n=1 Tax=Wenzhouxiangella marina TaxID=1579979 RepID=A0A0K0Y082_9GAMM|nr:beta-ketoacyl-[acyl-carrier-protein] synthase family protein [Wenzhouxiangella marina]AKS43353.1 3-oxoacyl-ACP synthase [Wenzhouxiangella marina]MBB6088532.1 3-oxoacyl-[acyl-carrier-protein] synthase-1 [Wenzhouxiangella marina]
MNSDLFVSAMTLCAAPGAGLDVLRRALAERRSGLRPNDFAPCTLNTWIGRVEGVEDTELPSELRGFDCRNNRLAELGLRGDDFIERVEILKSRLGAERIACVTGTSTAGIGSTEAAYRAMGQGEHFDPSFLLPRVHTPHTSSAYVAQRLGLNGPVMTISTACSSSAKVFAAAARLIEAGLADAAVVGGVDSLCQSVLYGFHSLELVSEHPCRPFDRDRDGLSLGEAAGFAILERQPEQAFGRLAGWGESSDAHHMASPHPEGTGAVAAMREALDRAGLDPEAIGYINCHGTATPMNDQVEARAIRQVFETPPPAASTKGWTGHTLGAAGIVEAVFSLLALNDARLPAGLNIEQPEDAWADFILTEARDVRVDHVLSNSFGFGGSNCSLIFARS